MYVTELIAAFEPPNLGHFFEEDFDPTVHMTISENKGEKFAEGDESENEFLEVDDRVERIRVEGITKIWLKSEPPKEDFIACLYNAFNEGLNVLKNFERWSRHDDLSPYVKVLESWDDKVCDNWESPEENHLNCEEWLSLVPQYRLRE